MLSVSYHENLTVSPSQNRRHLFSPDCNLRKSRKSDLTYGTRTAHDETSYLAFYSTRYFSASLQTCGVHCFHLPCRSCLPLRWHRTSSERFPAWSDVKMPKWKRVSAGNNSFVKMLRKSSATCLVRFSFLDLFSVYFGGLCLRY